MLTTAGQLAHSKAVAMHAVKHLQQQAEQLQSAGLNLHYYLSGPACQV